MLYEKKYDRMKSALVVGIVLLLSGGISQAADENLIADKPFAVTQPEMLEITQPEFLEVTEQEPAEITRLESLEVSEPKSLELGSFPRGKYTPAEQDNPAYDRCASFKDFESRHKCALEALGITPE